jgi:hypothetical protein
MSQSASQVADHTPATVSECRTVEVSTLRDEGLLEPDASGQLTWRRNGDAVGSMYVEPAVRDPEADTDHAVILTYVHGGTLDDVDLTEYRDTVSIETTSCNFGGERPWFRCPGLGCNERVGKLYYPPHSERFRCRHCHDPAYGSSRATRNPRKSARLRYERIHERLYPDADGHHPGTNGKMTIRKPKGMHWDTYEEIRADLRDAHDDWTRAMMKETARRSARFDRRLARHRNDCVAQERKEQREEIEAAIDDDDLWLCPADAAMLNALKERAPMAFCATLNDRY